MTSMQLHQCLSWAREANKIAEQQRGVLAHKDLMNMKAMLFGMLIAAALGPVVLTEMSPNSVWVREFSFSMAGGTLGAGFAYCFFRMKDFREMAQFCMGNLMLAVACGPSTCAIVNKTCGIAIDERLLMSVAFSIGFVGTSAVKIAMPIIASVYAKWVESQAKNISGP